MSMPRLELKKQIDDGLLPEPEYIFLRPWFQGYAGRTYGGCEVGGYEDQGVRSARGHGMGYRFAQNRAPGSNRLVSLMRKYDKNVAPLKFTMDDLLVTHDFFGEEYGAATQEGEQALRLVEQPKASDWTSLIPLKRWRPCSIS